MVICWKFHLILNFHDEDAERLSFNLNLSSTVARILAFQFAIHRPTPGGGREVCFVAESVQVRLSAVERFEINMSKTLLVLALFK